MDESLLPPDVKEALNRLYAHLEERGFSSALIDVTHKSILAIHFPLTDGCEVTLEGQGRRLEIAVTNRVKLSQQKSPDQSQG